MKICVIGTGYVGLVSAVCFAELGHEAVGVDIDESKIEKLKKGISPIYEENLEDLLKKNLDEGKISFTSNLKEGLKGVEVVINAVGTPPDERRKVDLRYVWEAAKQVAENLEDYIVFVNKSTVPVGTAEEVRKIMEKSCDSFDVASNPEFLREGSAVKDFLEPDRIVVGVESERAKKILEELYRPLVEKGYHLMVTDIKSAELIKYASNAFLATKISFINEVAGLCEKVGADIEEVAKGMGLDSRIGDKFLKPGPGYGGSCLDENEFLLIGNPTPELESFKMNFDSLSEKNLPLIRAVGFDGKNARLSNVKCFTKRVYNGKMIKVNTKMGKTLTVTEDHPMVIVNRGKFEIKLAKYLKENDEIPLLANFPRKKIERIDLTKILPHELSGTKIKVRPIKHKLEDYKKEIYPLLSKFNLSGEQKYDIFRCNCLWLEFYKKIAKKITLKKDNLQLFTSLGNTTYVPAIIELDEDFWRFIGYYLAEGHIHYEKSRKKSVRARAQLSFNEEEEEYINDACDILNKWNIKYRICHRPESSSRHIVFSSSVLAFLLDKALNCGTDSYSANIPKMAFYIPNNKKRALLAGLFRGDGSVYFHKHSEAISIEFGTASKRLAQGVIILLQSIGIIAAYKKAYQKKGKVASHFIRVNCHNQIKKMIFFDRETNIKMRKRLSGYKKKISPIGFKRYQDFFTVKINELKKETVKNKNVYSLEFEKPPHLFFTSFGLVVHNCFPKDVDGLISIALDNNVNMRILESVTDTNKFQQILAVQKLKKYIPNLFGKTIAVWGLAFKANTDDIRESSAIKVIEKLVQEGAKVKCYDPVATENAKKALDNGKSVEFVGDKMEALSGANALILMTEWDEFKKVDLNEVKRCVNAVVDMRNVWDKQDFEGGSVNYEGVGV